MDELQGQEFIGTIKLGVGHSLILGHVPKGIQGNVLSGILEDNNSTEIDSFGLWETATPNYSTYYPEVSSEDLEPKEEEFITPVFRLLSEVIVYKGVPIDFRKRGVLKGSMSKLLGQTINIDHEMAIGNAIGAVSEVFWQNSYKTKSGIVVPAGINGVLKIDGKSNPRIARGIMMKPPAIHSNSVTVKYGWEPSHKFDDRSEFYQKVGTYDKKGELIRCVVTDIMSYHETSLVSHGADAFAQKIEDGQIVNPEYAANTAMFTRDRILGGSVFIDAKDHISAFKLDSTIPEYQNTNNNNSTEKEMDELIASLETELGLEKGTLTKDNLTAEVQKLVADKDTEIQNLNDSVSSLEGERDGFKTKLDELQGKYDTLSANSVEVAKTLELTKGEAARLYKSVKGEKADENILTLISNADMVTAAAFVKQYREEAEGKFQMSCKSCGSTEITRASASTSKEGLLNDEGKDDPGETKQEKTNSEVLAKFRENKRKSLIFGK